MTMSAGQYPRFTFPVGAFPENSLLKTGLSLSPVGVTSTAAVGIPKVVFIVSTKATYNPQNLGSFAINKLLSTGGSSSGQKLSIELERPRLSHLLPHRPHVVLDGILIRPRTVIQKATDEL